MSSITITVAALPSITVEAAEAPATLTRLLVEDARYYGAWNYREAQAAAEAADVLTGMVAGDAMRCGSEYEIRVVAA